MGHSAAVFLGPLIAARYGLGFAPDGWQNLEAVFPDYATAELKDTGLVIDTEPTEDQPEKRSRHSRRVRQQPGSPAMTPPRHSG